jgi:16S rRNA (guanine527-N7)-methyltransferase
MNERLIEMLEELGIRLSDHQLRQFDTYFRLLVDWNQKLNLTSITERDEVYLKHFIDSLSLVRAVALSNQHILDVGSGAGFPSIPLKIVFPEIRITIIDAIQKRIVFLEELSSQLGIQVTLIHGRVEELPHREHYDIVTARAVANLRILSELCIPFVCVGGYFLAMKGPQFQEEVDESKQAFDILQAQLVDIITYEIEHLDRSIIKLKKLHPTPEKYPRRFKKIKSKPL